MHTLLAVGVTILTATQPQPTLVQSQPINVTFVMPVSFEQTISFLSQTSGVTIELDETVPQQMRQQPLSDYAMKFAGVTFEQAIAQIARIKGLSYTIVDEKTIRISKKA